ncbi:UDP-glucose 4-epimerase [Candidatus Magnetoovum chiemensis]|nr:UDP-glucose 4-epimerase [Candidatus Magnetoovum chiemensis]
MKILVTGGAGFIGSHVVDKYIADGHDVAVVDNLFTGKIENLNPRAKFYLLDIRSQELDKIFELEKPQIVNHHAAQMSVPASVEDPAFDASVNILGLINILQRCVKHKAQKIIFISTGGAIYGEAEEIPITEDCAPKPLSPYALTKFASENYLRFYNHQWGLEYTVLRYANIYGPRQIPHGEAGVVSIFMDKLVSSELPVIYHYDDEPEGMIRDYCFVGDIVKANALALAKAQQCVLNIGTGIGTNTMTLYREILKAARSENFALDVKFDSPAKAQARAGDLRRNCLNAAKAKNMLGWNADYTLKQGIDITFKYHLNKLKRRSD